MGLRAELADAAVSHAKAYGHQQVEPRHVLFAIAKRFRELPEVAPLFAAARTVLEPRGSAGKVAGETAEATALLGTIATEQDAIAALANALKGAGSAAGQAPGGMAARQSEAEAQQNAKAVVPGIAAKPEAIADILAELDALIGLGPVKAQVRKVIAVVQANTERKRAGLPPVNPSLHLVFTGPPGTGKTTVARIVARLYASTGALPGSGFTEATRADLIAGYIGQTAIKTTEVINRTRPGVLFVDEAYALTPHSAVDFGAEAIATLVKAMEDHREEFAVIVAGYSDEMADFVSSNPGLRSRFKTFLAFPNYAPPELLRIFEKFASEAEIGLAGGSREKVEQVLSRAVQVEDFGNARFVRSLFEQAYARMAARAAADGQVSVSELGAITPDDIVFDLEAVRREVRRVGFVTSPGQAT